MLRRRKPGNCPKRPSRILLPVVLTSALFMGCRDDPAPYSPEPEPVSSVYAPRELPSKAGPLPEAELELRGASPAGSKAPPRAPRDLQEALLFLEDRGLDRAAGILDARVKQQTPKMKLSSSQATKIAGHLLSDLPGMPSTRKLMDEMPHSTVELVRAVHERGVSRQDAEDISGYLLRFVESMDFGNQRQLDINHSHVIGRDWLQIDYSGERLDPHRQKANGERLGIKSFKKAEYIHLYFKSVHRLGYFKRIYRPNGKLPDF